MRLKEEQINVLAEKVLSALQESELVVVKKERGVVLSAVKDAIRADIAAEELLEKDSAALLEKTLRSMGSGPEIDRHKMLRMIKERLAKERKIVL